MSFRFFITLICCGVYSGKQWVSLRALFFAGAAVSALELVFIFSFITLGDFSVWNTFWPFISKPFLVCISDGTVHLSIECNPDYRMLTHQHDHTHESVDCLNSQTFPICSLFHSLCLLHLMPQCFVNTLLLPTVNITKSKTQLYWHTFIKSKRQISYEIPIKNTKILGSSKPCTIIL